MPRYQREPEAAGRRFVWTLGAALLAIHGILLLIFAGVVIAAPHAIEWIAEAAQAEFVVPDEPVITPTQLARPFGEMWAAGAD
jgi:hypothetical protein